MLTIFGPYQCDVTRGGRTVKRFALRAGRIAAATGSAAVLLFSCGEPRLAAQPAALPVVVLEARCLDPGPAELAAPVRATTQDGTAVDLWCGDRVEYSDGACRVRRGSDLTQVPCAAEPRPSGAGVLVP